MLKKLQDWDTWSDQRLAHHSGVWRIGECLQWLRLETENSIGTLWRTVSTRLLKPRQTLCQIFMVFVQKIYTRASPIKVIHRRENWISTSVSTMAEGSGKVHEEGEVVRRGETVVTICLSVLIIAFFLYEPQNTHYAPIIQFSSSLQYIILRSYYYPILQLRQ